MQRFLLVATLIGLCCLTASASPESPSGLNLSQPKFIDAAAIVLFASLTPEDFRRVSDEVVEINMTGRFSNAIRTMPNKPCSVQLLNMAQGVSVYGQFDFSRLSRDYQQRLGSGFSGVGLRLIGDNIYCDRSRTEVACRGVYDVTTGGVRQTGVVLKALSFIARTCPTAD